MPANEAAFLAATTTFVDCIQASIDAVTNAFDEIGVAIPADFNFAGFEPYESGKTGYINALTASLEEIDEMQAAGISHYNPAYLTAVHQFLGSLMGAELDSPAALPGLLAQLTQYANLYNDGAWSNVVTWLRQREMNRYSATFLGWYRAGGTSNPQQPLDMSLVVNWTPDGQSQSQSQTIQVGVYWTAALLRDAISDVIGPNNPFFSMSAPSGQVLYADSTQDLHDLGLKDGDTIDVTIGHIHGLPPNPFPPVHPIQPLNPS